MKWRNLARTWHINLGLFATITLGLIALSCFPIAHKTGGAAGKALKDIHEGKFLPDAYKWIWIDSQGLLLGWLILSGFLLHRRAKKVLNPEAPNVPGSSVVILFGSETGNAESVARRLGSSAEEGGLRAFVAPMDGYDPAYLKDERWLVVVTSTHGDGELPGNAQKFWSGLSEAHFPRLPRLRYAVFALGDSNYPLFCRAGQLVDERLAALGAVRLLDRVECDQDFETPAEQWLPRVLEALGAAEAAPMTASKTPKLEVVGPKNSAVEASGGGDGTKASPFLSEMRENRLLTRPGAEKETRHFVLSLGSSGINYTVGDALGVLPSNCHGLVRLTLDALGFDGEEEVPLPGGGSAPLRLALLKHYDITRPSRAFLGELCQRTQSDEVCRLLEPGAARDLEAFLRGREVLDLLQRYPKAEFSPEAFVASLRKLAPRLYSIASSPSAHPGEVHLTVAAVRYEAHGAPRKGVCSTFLADRVRGVTPVPVFVHPSKSFRLPQDGSRPVIMVGPGTGIAPFRAFLEEREATGATGGNWLFFGGQRRGDDFLYGDELHAFQERGVLMHFDTAFSREQADKIYVQDRLREQGARVWQWLSDGAHFYVCGDASRMAKDVDQVLHTVCREHGGLSEQAAADYVSGLRAEGRYQRDVY